MRKSKLKLMFLVVLLSITILLTGCATSRDIGKLPSTPEEFNLPKDKLIESYPDIAIYERGNSFFFLGYCTEISEVTKYLGEPDNINIKWTSYFGPTGLIGFAFSPLSGVVTTTYTFAVYPLPPKEYIWNKGIYNIVTFTDTSIHCGYKNRLFYWKWEIQENGRP